MNKTIQYNIMGLISTFVLLITHLTIDLNNLFFPRNCNCSIMLLSQEQIDKLNHEYLHPTIYQSIVNSINFDYLYITIGIALIGIIIKFVLNLKEIKNQMVNNSQILKNNI